jgi:toxin ParE1/3/4
VTDRISFEPAAQAELDQAADFYDLESAGLGTEFIDAVEKALRELPAFPESGPVLLGATRKLVVDRFPYSVLYWIDGERIVVSAIAHESRRPEYWRDSL